MAGKESGPVTQSTPLWTLPAAGRVTELRAGALELASHAFGWHRQPSALEMF